MKVFNRITVLVAIMVLMMAFIPGSGPQTAYADSITMRTVNDQNENSIKTFTNIRYDAAAATDIGAIQNVSINGNGIMTWSQVKNITAYTVVIDNKVTEYVTGTSFDLGRAIDLNIGNGSLKNKGNHSIYLETYSVSDYYTWQGMYKHFCNNVEVDTVFRYFGSTRYETSLKVADAFKEELGVDQFDNAIISFGGNYADALAGSFLSKSAKAPILIVDGSPARVSAVQTYIKENVRSGGTIYLLGGSAVVPDDIKNGLGGYNFERLGGADRYETNIKILFKGDDISPEYTSRLIVCSGNGFADSLSAAATGEPIMLVNGRYLTDRQKEYLAYLRDTRNLFITVVGGEGVVSKGLFSQLKAYGNAYRIGGSTRYETSILFAKHYYDNISCAVIANGSAFPDGLCGGPLAKALDCPLILTANGNTQPAVQYIKNECQISYGVVLGGPTLISDAIARNIFDISGTSAIVEK